MGMWKTWHHLEREDGSACLYYTLPGQSTHFVVYDTTDGPLKEIAGGYKRRAEAAEAENARLRERVAALTAAVTRSRMMDFNEFVGALRSAGWYSKADAQHRHIRVVWETLIARAEAAEAE